MHQQIEELKECDVLLVPLDVLNRQVRTILCREIFHKLISGDGTLEEESRNSDIGSCRGTITKVIALLLQPLKIED